MRLILIIMLLINTAYAQYPILVNGHKYASAGPDTLTIAIAFNSGGAQLYGGTNWNNHVSATNQNFTVVSDLVFLENGSASGIKDSLSQNSNSNDNGSTYCSGTTQTIFPAATYRYGSGYSGGSRTLTFKVLPAGNHTAYFMSSRATVANQVIISTPGATPDTLFVVQNNCDSVARIDFTSAGGEQVFTLTKYSGSFAYLNAMKLILRPTGGFAAVPKQLFRRPREMAVLDTSIVDALVAIKQKGIAR